MKVLHDSSEALHVAIEELVGSLHEKVDSQTVMLSDTTASTSWISYLGGLLSIVFIMLVYSTFVRSSKRIEKKFI